MRSLTEKLKSHPHRIFLMDGAGALLTAALLFFLVLPLNKYFQVLPSRLQHLSIIALCFSIYSFFCFLFGRRYWRQLLMVIYIANVLYCVFTAWTLFEFRECVTPLAVAYFSIEIAIVFALSFIELQLIKKYRS